MARKEVSGVRGVLGGLISASPSEQPGAMDSPPARPKPHSNMHTPATNSSPSRNPEPGSAVRRDANREKRRPKRR